MHSRTLMPIFAIAKCNPTGSVYALTKPPSIVKYNNVCVCCVCVQWVYGHGQCIGKIMYTLLSCVHFRGDAKWKEIERWIERKIIQLLKRKKANKKSSSLVVFQYVRLDRGRFYRLKTKNLLYPRYNQPTNLWNLLKRVARNVLQFLFNSTVLLHYIYLWWDACVYTAICFTSDHFVLVCQCIESDKIKQTALHSNFENWAQM